MHKMRRIQLFINDEASSSTLVEGLALMTTKDIITSIEFMKKQNLQSKGVCQGLGTTKVVFLFSTAPPNVGL